MRISDWSSDVCSSDLIGGSIDRAEFHPREKAAGQNIVELLGVQDVEPVLEQETRYRRDNTRPVDTGQSQHKFFVAQRVHPAPAAPHPMRCAIHPHVALQRGASTSWAGPLPARQEHAHSYFRPTPHPTDHT